MSDARPRAGRPQLTIHPAEPADAGRVAVLVRSAYRGEQSRAGWTTEADLLDDERIDAAGVRARIEREDGGILLAEDEDGELVGCCEIVRLGGGIVYFGLFAVVPNKQDARIGRAVLEAAERFAVERWAAGTMEMTVIAQRGELIDWYRRRGYRATGETRPFPYGDLLNGTARRDDLYFIVLAKPLTSS